MKYLLFLCLTLNISASENNICQIPNSEKAERAKKQDLREKILNTFSSNPIIANDADKMLSILIKAKSPMILNWVKKRQFNPETESIKIAIEWRKYFAMNFVINHYPSKDLVKDELIENLFKQLSDSLLTEKFKTEVNKNFLSVQKESIVEINKFPISETDKKSISDKINNIKIYWPENLKESKYIKLPLEFFDWSLAYDPHNNEINIGLNAVSYNSLSLKAAIIHEVAHSFDPCRWSTEHSQPWPFEKIGTCLRAFSKPRDDSQIENLLNANKILRPDYDFFKAHPTCNNSSYPPIGIQADQLPETFADWFATEVISKQSIDTTLRNDLCEVHILNPGSSYISNHDRLFKIYLSNLLVQKKLKSISSEKSCSF